MNHFFSKLNKKRVFKKRGRVYGKRNQIKSKINKVKSYSLSLKKRTLKSLVIPKIKDLPFQLQKDTFLILPKSGSAQSLPKEQAENSLTLIKKSKLLYKKLLLLFL